MSTADQRRPDSAMHVLGARRNGPNGAVVPQLKVASLTGGRGFPAETAAILMAHTVNTSHRLAGALGHRQRLPRQRRLVDLQRLALADELQPMVIKPHVSAERVCLELSGAAAMPSKMQCTRSIRWLYLDALEDEARPDTDLMR